MVCCTLYSLVVWFIVLARVECACTGFCISMSFVSFSALTDAVWSRATVGVPVARLTVILLGMSSPSIVRMCGCTGIMRSERSANVRNLL